MQIPETLLPVTSMGINNLVKMGYRIVDPTGKDVTGEVEAQRFMVEMRFMVWLQRNEKVIR